MIGNKYERYFTATKVLFNAKNINMHVGENSDTKENKKIPHKLSNFTYHCVLCTIDFSNKTKHLLKTIFARPSLISLLSDDHM